MKFLAPLFFLLCALTAHAAESVPVGPDLWDRPRSAAVVMADPGVKRALALLLARPDARLAIRHARAQGPAAQAEELRGWLIALALDAERIALRADLASGAGLVLEISP